MLYMQKECLPPVLAMTFKDNLHTRFSDHGRPNVVVIGCLETPPRGFQLILEAMGNRVNRIIPFDLWLKMTCLLFSDRLQ